MLGKLRLAKRLFRDLPQYTKLAYCLLRDHRVPAWHKAALGVALGVGLNPMINLPEFVPVLGELDALAITLVSMRLFIASSPGYIVDEHRQLLVEERSVFDRDLRAGEGRIAQCIDTVSRRLRSDIDGPQQGIELDRSPAPMNERKVSA